MALSNNEINKILKAIHEGKMNLKNLPKDIFLLNFDEIMSAIDKGFGKLTSELKVNRMLDYEDNVFKFSGAKTFQETKDLMNFVFTETGAKRPFKEFRDFAQQINNQYNVVWLKTEQDTAFGMSQSANQWFDIQEDKELFPMLKYQTAADERVRDEHAAWDNIVRPVDDDFWTTRMPINDFNCRCSVIQVQEQKVTSLRGKPQNSSDMFNVNPGKVNYIFNEKKHPYFKVEKRFKPDLDKNFGFKKPER